jgi:hypothetical protein
MVADLSEIRLILKNIFQAMNNKMLKKFVFINIIFNLAT